MEENHHILYWNIRLNSLRVMSNLKDKVMNHHYQDRRITNHVNSPCFKRRNSFNIKLKIEQKRKKAATSHQLLLKNKRIEAIESSALLHWH